MPLLRAPKLTVEHLKTLKDLLRLDYCRGLRIAIERDRANPGTHVAETCLQLLRLTDALTEAENPLVVTEALMDVNGTDSVFFPLKPQKYDLYMKVLGFTLAPEHFPGLTDAQIEDIAGPYKESQKELLQIFEDADYIDTDIVLQDVPFEKEPPSGLLN
jgi:hypothetical protein